jgi:hypothetical protein
LRNIHLARPGLKCVVSAQQLNQAMRPTNPGVERGTKSAADRQRAQSAKDQQRPLERFNTGQLVREMDARSADPPAA